MLGVSDADDLLSKLAVACLQGSADLAADEETRLTKLSADELIRLDDRARFTTWSRPNPLGPAEHWEPRIEPGSPALVPIVAALHRDGYLRERAVERLSQDAGATASRVLALRAVDHVPQVRSPAIDALTDRVGPESIPIVVGVLARLAGRAHGREVIDRYLAAAGPFDRELLGSLIASEDFLVRRLGYQGGLARDLLDVQALAGAIAQERDQWSRRMLAEEWARRDPAHAKGHLLRGRYVEGRLTALYEVPQEFFQPSDLEPLMLDTSSRVREAARWRYRRAGGDPQGFYRSRWNRTGLDDPLAHRILQGLREAGLRLTEEQAQAAARSQRGLARLEALRLWPEPGPGRALLLGLLADDSPPVVKEAASQLAAMGLTRFDDVAGAAASPLPNQRRAAWLVRRDLGPWDRVRADLEAMHDPAPELSALAQADLLKWLTYRAATVYQVPFPSEKAAIKDVLAATDFPSELKGSIAFHARIAMEDAPQSPTQRRRTWWSRRPR